MNRYLSKLLVASQLVLMVFLSTPTWAQQSDISYSDWRLDRPVLHGYLVGLSLGLIDVQSSQWTQASELDPSGYPAAAIKYIEQHKKVPYAIGFSFGALTTLSLLFSLVFYYTQGKRSVRKYKQREINGL